LTPERNQSVCGKNGWIAVFWTSLKHLAEPEASVSNVKYRIGALLIGCALTYMVLQGAHNFSSYFVTVQDFRAHLRRFGSQTLRVQGVLQSQSVHYNANTATMRFLLTGGHSRLWVRYRGAMPNERFRNADAIVKGHLGRTGVFQAQKLEIQCPNHYGPPEGTN
jgi:cytochrome c-type biogenesis protein CcmE